MVMGALDDLREEAGYRCPWLTPDLCTRTVPCPAQHAGCDVQLQINLMDDSLDDVCKYVRLVFWGGLGLDICMSVRLII